MEFVLLALAFGVAAVGFIVVKRSQPPALVRVRAVADRRNTGR